MKVQKARYTNSVHSSPPPHLYTHTHTHTHSDQGGDLLAQRSDQLPPLHSWFSAWLHQGSVQKLQCLGPTPGNLDPAGGFGCAEPLWLCVHFLQQRCTGFTLR